MPQRRNHRKSRYGCDQCRKRRVKCDEQPPRCSNCITRDEHCHFSKLPPQRHSTPQTTPSPHSSVSLFDPNPATSIHASRSGSERPTPENWASPSIKLQELELMHHWSTRTYTTTGPEWHMLFRDYVTKEALRHPYLLSTILATTSFHLAVDALPTDLITARKYVSIGLQYQDEALSGLRNVLSAITPDNSAAVLFGSILISLCAIVSPLLPVGENEATQTSTAEAFLPLVDYLNAVESVKEVTVPLLEGSSISDYIDSDFQSEEVDRPLFTSELYRLNTILSPLEKQPMYEKAISDLETNARKDDTISRWLPEVGPAFLAELRRGESLALAIYMHWGMLVDQLDGLWWAKFSGKRLVEELSLKLRERGPEWEEVVRWCRRQVGLLEA